MSKTNKVNITLSYGGASTRTVSFNNVPDTRTLVQIGQAAASINNNMSDFFKQTFLSVNGAQCTSIGKVQVITTEEEMIYSAN